MNSVCGALCADLLRCDLESGHEGRHSQSDLPAWEWWYEGDSTMTHRRPEPEGETQ